MEKTQAYNLSLGPSTHDHLVAVTSTRRASIVEGEVEFKEGEWRGEAPAVDARHPVSSLNNRLALAMHYILHPTRQALTYWYSNCDARLVITGVASQPPPSPAEIMREMVETGPHK